MSQETDQPRVTLLPAGQLTQEQREEQVRAVILEAFQPNPHAAMLERLNARLNPPIATERLDAMMGRPVSRFQMGT